MAVSDGDGDDAAEEVEVAAALVVVEPLHVALVDQQRLPVVREHGRIQIVGAHLAHPLHVRTLLVAIDSFIRWFLFDIERKKAPTC